MAFPAAIHSNLPTSSSHHLSKFWSPRPNRKHKRLALRTALLNRGHSIWIIKSVLDNGRSGLSDNGANEPARVLLERLFAQTQKLEERMNKDSPRTDDILLGLNLESLESDLLAALTALKRKEEDLQDAERMVLSEHTELNHAKEELERRETQISALCSKQEKLEEDLKFANLNLASQARQIEDLKLQLRERDQEIATAQSALSVKEDELNKTKNELVKQSEEAAKVDSELKLKAHFLNKANEVVKNQEIELQELRKAIIEKEEELEVSVVRQKVDGEKIEVVEANLKKQTMEYLIVQDELKKLAEEASKNMKETNDTLEGFRRVRKLLTDVRSELVSSQKFLVSSRQKMEDQWQLLEKQLEELEEQRKSVMSYMKSLKDAKIEVESERVNLRVAEARNKELELDLAMEKELTEELQKVLKKEKSSLQQAIQEMSSLQEELDRRSTKFAETCNLLQVKESELVEAKLEVQHLKSEQASLQHILKNKDWELLNSRNRLKEVTEEVTELKMLMNSREDQLVQATSMLKEKEEHVQMMEHELNTTKLKFSEAETVVEQIAELTNKLVVSIKDEDNDVSSTFHNMGHDSTADKFNWQRNQLENELELIRESLRTKEMEALAAQRAISMKDEELKVVLERLDARDREVRRLKEEMIQDTDDLKKLYGLAQERIGEKSIGDLAIEKLQLEAAQLEVEAATGALHKLAEMSRELLNKASLSIESDSYTSIFPLNGFDPRMSEVDNNESLTEVKTEVARLSALTEQLVHEAGIVNKH